MTTSQVNNALLECVWLEGKMHMMAFKCQKSEGIEHCSDQCKTYTDLSTRFFALYWDAMTTEEEELPEQLTA